MESESAANVEVSSSGSERRSKASIGDSSSNTTKLFRYQNM